MRRVIGYKEYTTREGDTFDALALEMYGEETLAHYIIEFNPDHADVLIFDGNVSLRLPIVENTETPDTLPPWRRDSEEESEASA
ncbi:MAG: tail protein X [Paludibacteraceae bacterium]|nr:tail protein X [Paludibacteraceae bacterium]